MVSIRPEEKMKKKVSVVVPVYNVKEYLPTCLESLERQNYDNLQVILVDDGSTDGSGEICDQYADKQSNTEVIHQENQGLSGARNSGTKVSTGYYIAYIDSDDWVSHDYISHQVELAERYNADIVAVRQQSVWEGLAPEKIDYSGETIICYNQEEALETMLYGYKLQTSACKLFKREIISKYPFPVGELYEDAAIMYNVFCDVNSVVVSNLPLYCYRRRKGSIINERFDPRHLVIIEHANQIYDLIKNKHPQLIQAAGYRHAYSITEIAPKILSAENLELFRFAQEELKKHYNDLMRNKKASKKIKIRGFAIKHGMIFTKMERKAETIYKTIIGKNLYGE